MHLSNLPLFDELKDTQTVLLAGAGGGYDVFCGLPLFHALRAQGKTVYLANLSFSYLSSANEKWHAPHMLEVTPETIAHESYFPELHLVRWLRGQGIETSIFCFPNEGVASLRGNYQALCEMLKPDALVLVDGGTDSLMRGDETGLGTPHEDCASLYAAQEVEIATKLLVCVGFGVDAFHGVCHAQFLEAVADVSRKGGFLGVCSLLPDMPEVEFYREACQHVFSRMQRMPSIVSSSILDAIEGHFGDYHSTARTNGSKLFINPLMAMLWTFRVEDVARRLLYPAEIRETQSWDETAEVIARFRSTIAKKPFETLPM
ncbi:DUF1152 domain-containing protein [bacterium]|nr:MAG: DUF1152 domain-containing protein [bacterium]